MAKPKIKVIGVAVESECQHHRKMIESYCAREFGRTLLYKLKEVCDEWLEKASETVLSEQQILKELEKDKKDSKPS